MKWLFISHVNSHLLGRFPGGQLSRGAGLGNRYRGASWNEDKGERLVRWVKANGEKVLALYWIPGEGEEKLLKIWLLFPEFHL